MASSKPLVVYWDSCVFIDRIQRTPARIELLESITNLAASGGLAIVTSTLTIVEVLRGPDSSVPTDAQAKAIKEFFENDWIVLRSVDRPIAERAADLRRAHRLKTADSVHVATALHNSVVDFHTYDNDHLIKRNGRCGSPPLTIIEPNHPEDLPLFDPPALP